jgi:ferrous iron transport protein B
VSDEGAPLPDKAEPVIVLVGNPNSGKTTIFNALTGLSARVGNYPGITVEHGEGHATLPDGRRARVVDLPGTYSLVPRADDEAVALRGVLGTLPFGKPDLVVAVVDATSLERNLYAVAQLRELGAPTLVALTMMDVLDDDERVTDVDALTARIGLPVVRAAKDPRRDAEGVLNAIPDALARGAPDALAVPGTDSLPPAARERLELVGMDVRDELSINAPADALGLWAAAAHAMGSADRLALPDRTVRTVEAMNLDPSALTDVVQARYRRVEGWADGVISGSAAESHSERFTTRVDRVVLHRFGGPLVLLGVFAALFQALFSWSSPLMDLIEGIMGVLSTKAGELIPASTPLLRSLVMDGVIAGVGNVVVFVPQIAALFLFLGLLEDSGYLARAAFLLDRLMARVGLHGRAFVPMLSGFACAVPAILATRTIESTKDRIVTILVTPLVSCSARLPVYALVIAAVFSTQPPVLGFISVGALVMIAMYLLGIVAAIGMAALFKRTLLKSPTPPLVLELPPYRTPRIGDVLKHTWSRVRVFLVEAGTVILAITIVLWALFTFPRSDELLAQRDQGLATLQSAQLADESMREPLRTKIEARYKQRSLEQSFAGRLGHAIEPVIEPLGFDWKIGVGLIASFAAREVLVSTLGLVYGLGDDSDEESVPLRAAIRADRHPETGKPIYTPLTGLALLVFFVLAMQCMSTLAVVKRETRSWRWPMFQLGYMTALAWVGALIVFQGGRLLGFG